MTEEQRTERVLDALRQAEPLPGMEARLLMRMAAERETAPAPDGSRWWHMSAWTGGVPRRWTHPAWAIAGLSGVLLLGGGLLRHGTRIVPSATLRSQPRLDPPTETIAPGHVVVPRQEKGLNDVAIATHVVMRPKDSQRREAVRLPQTPESTKKTEVAESFPAPPMPLTRQERLLLRMLSAGERTDLVATLSAGAEQAMSLQEAASRRAFFTPVRPATLPRDGALDNEELPDPVGHSALPSKASDQGNFHEMQEQEKQ